MSETDQKELTGTAIDIPSEARARGTGEILRVGMMSEEFLVAARPAFDNPGLCGEVVAGITRAASPGSVRRSADTPTGMRWLRSDTRSRPTWARRRPRATPGALTAAPNRGRSPAPKAPVRKTARRKAH